MLIALALAWSLLPGTHELAEQIVHVAQTGHFAHSIPDDPDARPDSEHGCQGPAHLCRCCPTVPLVIPAGVVSMRPPEPSPRMAWGSTGLHDDPLVAGVFRPPIS
jgi:hypothetical protein